MWRRWWSSGGGPTGLGSIIIVGNGSLVATLSILVYLRRTLCDSAAAINGGGGGGIGGGEAGGDGYHNRDSNGNNNDNDKDKDSAMSFVKVRRLMRLVNVEALKRKLIMEGKEIIRYSKLIQACESMGVARSNKESINDFRLCTFSMFSFL